MKQNSECRSSVGEQVLLCLSLFLVYAYIKEELYFSFIWVLLPALFVLAGKAYFDLKSTCAIRRASALVSTAFWISATIVACYAIKDEGGNQGGLDDNKWAVRHRGLFWLIGLAIGSSAFFGAMTPGSAILPPLAKQVLLNVFSSLSMPLAICSGGACNSIYISTITSILSAFSVPVTLVVPILNYVGYLLQLFGLIGLYSADKWRSIAFWIYVLGMALQLVLPAWFCCLVLIGAVILNAKSNQVVYGRKIFKSDLL